MKAYSDIDAQNKFWSNVNKINVCWVWTGHLDKWGSPLIRTNKKEYSARRMSLYLYNIELKNNIQVFYICGNKLCVNPEHLITGNEARFWSKVQKLNEENGCWIWISAEDKNGYGKFTFHDGTSYKDIRSHRYSWELYTGRKIPDDILVCHHCDNPRCVNPHHLFLGTNLDNMQDKKQKGRSAKGINNGRALLTIDQVKEIRKLYLTNIYTYKKLSNLYNISKSVIGAIIRNEYWKDI